MILDECLFEQTEQTQTVYISENAPGMKFIILQDGHFEIEQNGKREHYQTKDIQDLLDVLDSTGFIKETNEDLTDKINQQIDDRNANYEADKQATRDMRQELAKQGIATDTNGNPLNEDARFNSYIEQAEDILLTYGLDPTIKSIYDKVLAETVPDDGKDTQDAFEDALEKEFAEVTGCAYD
jgi:hypothetical protein